MIRKIKEPKTLFFRSSHTRTHSRARRCPYTYSMPRSGFYARRHSQSSQSSSSSSSVIAAVEQAANNNASRRSRPAAVGMLFALPVIFCSTIMVAVVGYSALRPFKLRFVYDFCRNHLNYNYVAIRNIVEDRLQARNNKTELPKLTGKVAVVTGGARGIGVEVVRMLLQCDVEVVIACRNESAAEKTIANIRKSGVTSGKTRVIKIDNANLDSVRKFVAEFKKHYSKLDILVNNAGIMFTPYGETEDGFENQYGVNYLSHFLLTLLLVPLLSKAGTEERYSRVVNVSSCAHLLGDIRFDDINHKKNFITGEAYAQSKLAQLLFTKKLAKLFSEKRLPIQVNAVHPGVVATDLFDYSYLYYFKPLSKIFFKTPVEGATPIVYAAVNPTIEKKSGMYISNCQDSPINPLADDESLQNQLFDLSLKQTQIDATF
uniref:Dehydrogenase with different specificities related to short-chain alcohol dehydrogenase n=1 Tax=Trichogramma kaykai TaxID=54128 RepID=A0ABD2WPW5_9HYME